MVAHLILVGKAHRSAHRHDQDMRHEGDILLDHGGGPGKADGACGDAASGSDGNDSIAHRASRRIDQFEIEIPGHDWAGRAGQQNERKA